MHQDTKLGLALGMLVLGFGAAFCFPRPVLPSAHAPAVEQVQFVVPIRAEKPTETPVSIPSQGDKIGTSTSGVAESLSPTTHSPEPTPAITQPAVQPEAPPASVAIAPALPSARGQSPQPETYTVQPGDTLTGIASRTLGNSQRYYDLFLANQHQMATPDALRPGLILVIPSESTPPGSVPTGEPGFEPQPTLAIPAQYEVRAGDTLEGIAQRFYGDRNAVPQLRTANPHVTDPKKLTVGTRIDLPVLR